MLVKVAAMIFGAASARLDPGTGSMVSQALVGVMATIGWRDGLRNSDRGRRCRKSIASATRVSPNRTL